MTYLLPAPTETDPSGRAAPNVFNNRLAPLEQVAPLRRAVTTEEVGNVVAFLASDLASGITGEIVYVDAGYNILGFGVG